MYSVIWSPNAKQSYLELLDFMLSNGGFQAALNLDTKVNHLISQLKTFNRLCPTSQKRVNLRRCVVNKTVSFTYEIIEDTIQIVAFYDNRSNH